MEKISQDRINTLHPAVSQQVYTLLSGIGLSVGTTIRVTQALRTFPEQQALFEQGRTTPGKIVTNAGAGQSIHNYGLAFDFVLLKKGKPSWTVDSDWMNVVDQFKKAGWTWGGDWHSIKDYPHLEKTSGYTWQQLLDKYHKKDFITGTQYVRL